MPTVAVINGSLRKTSLNGRLARALARLAAPHLEFRSLGIADLPLYNQDDEVELPAAVARFKQEITAADAVLFVTPEHNRSMPAALKNAIDWGSRPYGTSVWPDKPGAVIGTSSGTVGTAVAQAHLRAVLTSLGVALMGRPEAYVVFREGLLDEADNVVDATALKMLSAYAEALGRWVKRLA
ncbi:MAG: NADPH-dependent FMN reductase [Pseudomonadota bacterium]